MDESAIETVLSAVLAVVAGTADVDVVVFDLDVEIGIDGLLELAFRTFNCHNVVVDLYSYALGYFDGCLTYT